MKICERHLDGTSRPIQTDKYDIWSKDIQNLFIVENIEIADVAFRRFALIGPNSPAGPVTVFRFDKIELWFRDQDFIPV